MEWTGTGGTLKTARRNKHTPASRSVGCVAVGSTLARVPPESVPTSARAVRVPTATSRHASRRVSTMLHCCLARRQAAVSSPLRPRTACTVSTAGALGRRSVAATGSARSERQPGRQRRGDRLRKRTRRQPQAGQGPLTRRPCAVAGHQGAAVCRVQVYSHGFGAFAGERRHTGGVRCRSTRLHWDKKKGTKLRPKPFQEILPNSSY